jgi:hypothetical protein
LITSVKKITNVALVIADPFYKKMEKVKGKPRKNPLRKIHHFQKTVKWLPHAVLVAWPVIVSHL